MPSSGELSLSLLSDYRYVVGRNFNLCIYYLDIGSWTRVGLRGEQPAGTVPSLKHQKFMGAGSTLGLS